LWFAQGFVQDEDVALRKAVADYEKASGNKIELSITPFAPERQKIIAALTSGVVPDMMANNPAEICRYTAGKTGGSTSATSWTLRRPVQRDRAAVRSRLQQRHQEARHVRRAAEGRRRPLPYLAAPGGEGRLQDRGHPKTWDAYFDFFKKVQDNLRKQGERKVYGLGFQVTANGVDPYNLFMAFLVAHGGSRYRHEGRQAASRRPEDQAGGDQGAGYLGGAYRDGLRAAERHQLERRRRQQRLPRKAHGDGRRRDAVDRGRGQGEAPGVVLTTTW
jgi:multiple sugar transport system substrate-binding protein